MSDSAHDFSPQAATSAAYAERIVQTLAAHFPQLRQPTVATAACASISAYLSSPTPSWELVVDSPAIAHWALVPNGHGGIAVACRRPPTAATLAREHELTTLLERNRPQQKPNK
ncbi:hypothetical protein [Nonomuraea sp. SYSU D8015]|uniref:hypothetical protein n=1 Tax=Nonomuraea sp. SYSU D8015 TaxID=2593644 RepID=UPI001661377A|nr:hypothetical protein [Nonomuraea sp. SYSU D8015]